MKKVSIVVPVYNVEKYLQDCVQSILNQTYKDIEVLLIDDGSIDSSPQICDKFAEDDNRVKVFHIKNGGVSNARNLGIKNATGEFVAFVDSDDLACQEYISKLVNCLINSGADLSVCGYKMQTDKGTFDVGRKNDRDIYYAHKSEDFFKLYQHSLTPSVWGKLFIKEKITKLFDTTLNYGEDDLFILDYLKNANKIAFVNEPLYIYRNEVRETLTRNAYKNLIERFENLQDRREEAIKSFCDNSLALSALAMSNVRQSTIVLEAEIKTNNSYKSYKKLFRNLRQNEYFKKLLKISKPRYFKEKVILYVYKLNLPCILYRFLKNK